MRLNSVKGLLFTLLFPTEFIVKFTSKCDTYSCFSFYLEAGVLVEHEDKHYKEMVHMKKGFTLIELMIVITIIALLAAVAVPKFTEIIDVAKKSNVLANLTTLRTSIAMFQVRNGRFPVVGTDFTNNSATVSTLFQAVYSGGTELPEVPAGTNVVGVANAKKNRINAINQPAILSMTMPANGNGAVGWWYNQATAEVRAYLPTNAYGETTNWATK